MGNSDHGTKYMRVGGDDGELRPWHYVHVYSHLQKLRQRARSCASRGFMGGHMCRSAPALGCRV